MWYQEATAISVTRHYSPSPLWSPWQDRAGNPTSMADWASSLRDNGAVTPKQKAAPFTPHYDEARRSELTPRTNNTPTTSARKRIVRRRASSISAVSTARLSQKAVAVCSGDCEYARQLRRKVSDIETELQAANERCVTGFYRTISVAADC